MILCPVPNILLNSVSDILLLIQIIRFSCCSVKFKLSLLGTLEKIFLGVIILLGIQCLETFLHSPCLFFDTWFIETFRMLFIANDELPFSGDWVRACLESAGALITLIGSLTASLISISTDFIVGYVTVVSSIEKSASIKVVVELWIPNWSVSYYFISGSGSSDWIGRTNMGKQKIRTGEQRGEPATNSPVDPSVHARYFLLSVAQSDRQSGFHQVRVLGQPGGDTWKQFYHKEKRGWYKVLHVKA